MAEEDDRRSSLKDILAARGCSLVAELLAIQQHAQRVERCRTWAASLLCLRYMQSHSTRLELVANPDLVEDFVAVSWNWKAAIGEDQSSGKYAIMHARAGHIQPCSIRDSVLDRVIDYMEFTGLDLFWIDRACINQFNAEERSNAINSMDLIYQGAAKSVGLLTTPIRTQRGLHLIESLMEGNSYRDLKMRQNYWDTINTIEVLHNLIEDPWWHRAWIFQEEYIAGPRMDLMIPLAEGVQPFARDSVAGKDLIVNCIQFRRQTTDFLMLYRNTGWRRYRSSCENMLATVGRYNRLLPDDKDGIQSMSARVVEDVGKRGITKAWDSLAIVANTCGYEIRLQVESLFAEGRSLSISLIAQFLLNGECFHNDDQEHGSVAANALDVDCATFLSQLSARECLLPAESRQLSFFKNCRLPQVRFGMRSIHTHGLIWELPRRNNIHTSRFGLSETRSFSMTGTSSEAWRTQELEALIVALEPEHAALARKIHRYLERRRAGVASQPAVYMDRMLCKLVQAICKGYILRVGYLEEGGAGAIFIPNYNDVFEDMHVFTAWQRAEGELYELDNFVSLKVGLRRRDLRSRGWIDGLAFFVGKDPYPVRFDWDREWLKVM